MLHAMCLTHSHGGGDMTHTHAVTHVSIHTQTNMLARTHTHTHTHTHSHTKNSSRSTSHYNLAPTLPPLNFPKSPDVSQPFAGQARLHTTFSHHILLLHNARHFHRS